MINFRDHLYQYTNILNKAIDLEGHGRFILFFMIIFIIFIFSIYSIE